MPFHVKRNSKLFRALVHFLILMATAATVSGQVYKWVDERGVTHYGERPPQGGKASEVPNRLASPPPGTTGNQGSAPPSNPNSRQGEALPKDQDSRPGTIQAEEDRQAAKRQQQCNQQRALLAHLKQSPAGFTLNQKGEQIPLDNSEAIARQEKLVAEQCRG
ncbi:MAG TPA: DUF4124 domain-containing protein [Burkholderiales bacterium]